MFGYRRLCTALTSILAARAGLWMLSMQRLFRTVSSTPAPEKPKLPGGGHNSSGSLDSAAAVDKLRSFRDLAEEALEKAYAADVHGEYELAKNRYKIGLDAVKEGLKQNAPETGLGPAYDNVAKWKKELNTWQQLVRDRLRDLDAPRASSSAPAGTAKRITRQTSQSFIPSRPALQSYNRTPSQAPATAAKKGGGSSGAADSKLREVILAEVLDSRPSVRWEDVAGLGNAKQALQEMVILPALRADLFRGLRSPARGLLLYGPPGNGKTLLAKALANEAKATFFNISASSLTSKWHGEAEKLVRMLFAVAAEMQPSIIFIDEIDSILSERSSGEHEASRRLKTQFLVEFDGVAQASNRVVVIGATNRPQELDDAVRRRMVKRIYIPMPGPEGRRALLRHTLEDQPTRLSAADLERLVEATEGYSGSDLAALCREAAMQPLRELGPRVSTVSADKVRPMVLGDFQAALAAIRPSVSPDQLRGYEEWTRSFGTQS